MDQAAQNEVLARLKTFLAELTPPLWLHSPRPPVPSPNEYSPPWRTPVELTLPKEPRTLIQIHRFEELGQRLELSTQKC